MNTSYKFYLFIFLCIIPLIFSQGINGQNKNINIIIEYLKKLSFFFKQKDNFIYNTPDNAESLYQYY